MGDVMLDLDNTKFRQKLKPEYVDSSGEEYHYWGYIDEGFVSPVGRNVSLCKGEQFTGYLDSEGVEIYNGDKLEYYHLYECYSDAVDYYGVEPENNFPVQEVYIDDYIGEVVNGRLLHRNKDFIDIPDLAKVAGDRLMDLYYMEELEFGLREYVSIYRDAFGKNPIRKSPFRVVK